jgi:hypothetical protein
MASVDSSFLGNRKANKLLQQYRDCYDVFSMGFLLGPCRGYISRPTKVNIFLRFLYIVLVMYVNTGNGLND